MKLLLRSYILVIMVISSFQGMAQTISDRQMEDIEQFVAHVQNGNWEELAVRTHYPLERQYPVPDIEGQAEFFVRQTEVFDDSLRSLITNSLTDSTAWSLGKGSELILKNGVLSLDSLGYLSSINYESDVTRELKKQLIEEDRKTLPVSMQEYVRPILQMKTEKFLVRIDETKGPSYRLIVWIQGRRNPNVPAVNIMPNGVLARFEASGDYTYTFKSDLGTFVCYMSATKEDGSLPADLLLYRDNELVRVYPAIWLQN